jgi:ribosomal protein S18 acetylase RimI-like enzyme
MRLHEISDERLQSYLSRANTQVDNRLNRMSQARERLSKGWEIYDHNDPTRIIDRFEADSPREAQQYYQNFIDNHNPGDENFEFYLRRSTGIMEIARIPQGDFGDKDTLRPMPIKPKTKPLPGGSRFSYAVNKRDPEFMEIMIFDGDTLAAELDLGATLDPLKTWQVETIATDPDYRGQGLGKALYGIALNILKLTLEAGDTQTKHGQAMWIMLNSIPGVEVKGYAMDRTGEYRARPGDDIVDQNDTWTRYTFPVEPGRRSMRSTRRGTGIYSSQHVSMIAKWTGQ